MEFNAVCMTLNRTYATTVGKVYKLDGGDNCYFDNCYFMDDKGNRRSVVHWDYEEHGAKANARRGLWLTFRKLNFIDYAKKVESW